MLSAEPCEGLPLLLMGPGMGRVPETPRCISTKVLWAVLLSEKREIRKSAGAWPLPQGRAYTNLALCAGYVLSHSRVTITLLLQGKVCNHAHFPDEEKLRFRD